MQNILQTVFQHLIFAKGLKRWPNMLNIMQHGNLLLSVHKDDGDGWSWWWWQWRLCWTWWWSWGWWRWHAEDLEYYATREPALSVHLPGTPEAPVSHRFKRWSGPSLTSWSTKSTLESVNISKYSKGCHGHLSNQLHHFSIVVRRVQTCEHRWHLFHYAHLLSLPWKIVSPVVDGTTIWIVAMIFSQRSSEDLLWAQRLRT